MHDVEGVRGGVPKCQEGGDVPSPFPWWEWDRAMVGEDLRQGLKPKRVHGARRGAGGGQLLVLAGLTIPAV